MYKIREVKQILSEQDGLSFPSSLAYDKESDNLYICNMNQRCIIEMNLADGKYRTISSQCAQPGQELKKPLAITLDGNQKVIVTDVEQNCIFYYKEEKWRQISYIGTYEMNLPGSIAVDNADYVYVSDFLNQNIIRIKEGKNLEVLKQIKCKKPYGIFIKGKYLYTVCAEIANVQRMNLETGENEILLSGYSPIALTVDGKGNIYFSETRKLYVLNENTKEIGILIDKDLWKKIGFPRITHIGAMVSIDENSLIISDTIRNCLYELEIE